MWQGTEKWKYNKQDLHPAGESAEEIITSLRKKGESRCRQMNA